MLRISPHVRRDLKAVFSSHTTHLFLALILLLILVPFLVAVAMDIKPARKIEYGVTFSAPYAASLGYDWKQVYLEILDDLKVDNLRLIVYWDEVERREGVYDFSAIRWQLEEARKRDIGVVMSIGRKVPRWPECHDPYWLSSKDEAGVKESLLRFLEEEVANLKEYGNIKLWQVENEPFFPFGECEIPSFNLVKKEVDLVRSLDRRPIIVQDSGEGGFWLPTYKLGDYLGISMYRRIWYDFWGVFLGRHVFFTYPLAHWSYPLKARLLGIPIHKIKVLELQAEPWGDRPVNKLSEEAKDKTMSKDKFLETVSYAQKTGIESFYFWGAEWWYFEKEENGNPFFWEAAKAFWR
ncbi:hypothetical protein HY419_00120 [candidate division WWE3 bacterium]|nr:hypothetical protein [candidate division WWE3 bacterium]